MRSGTAKTAWPPVVTAMRGKPPAERVSAELATLMKSVEAGLDAGK